MIKFHPEGAVAVLATLTKGAPQRVADGQTD